MRRPVAALPFSADARGSVPLGPFTLFDVVSDLDERPIDPALLKNLPHDGAMDIHIGPLNNYESRCSEFIHGIDDILGCMMMTIPFPSNALFIP